MNEIKKTLKELESIFNQKELSRLNRKEFPFYDGGLSPIVIYYKYKYQLSIPLPNYFDHLKNKSETLYQITWNFYPNQSIKPKLESESDIFESSSLKKYYFEKSWYDFNIIWKQFIDQYKSKSVNIGGQKFWKYMLADLLLAFLVLKDNPELGFKNKSNMEKKYHLVMKYALEYLNLNEFLEEPEYYSMVFWIYQTLEPNDPNLKKNGKSLIKYLIGERHTGFLWTFSDIDNDNYVLSWIIFGLISDYFSFEENVDYYLISDSDSDTYLIQTEEMIEGFTNNNKKSNSNTSNFSKLMGWILFPVILFVIIKLFIWMTQGFFIFFVNKE